MGTNEKITYQFKINNLIVNLLSGCDEGGFCVEGLQLVSVEIQGFFVYAVDDQISLSNPYGFDVRHIATLKAVDKIQHNRPNDWVRY